eukprot:4082186-Prymnesium_polylepis.1
MPPSRPLRWRAARGRAGWHAPAQRLTRSPRPCKRAAAQPVPTCTVDAPAPCAAASRAISLPGGLGTRRVRAHAWVKAATRIRERTARRRRGALDVAR